MNCSELRRPQGLRCQWSPHAAFSVQVSSCMTAFLLVRSKIGLTPECKFFKVVRFKSRCSSASCSRSLARASHHQKALTTMLCASSLVVCDLGNKNWLLSGLFSALPLDLVVVFVFLLTVGGKSFLPPEAHKRYGDCMCLRRW